MNPVVIDFHTHPYLSGEEFLNFYPECFTPSPSQCQEDLERAGIFRHGTIAYGVERVGSERFLFGTDYPICNPRMYVQAIYQELISEADRENIVHRNVKRLLRLKPIRESIG